MNNLIYLYDLDCRYDRQKSFYGKARIFRNDAGSIFLMSYSTIVAEVQDATITEDGRHHAIVYDWYSNTTSRHVNEFLRQHGFNAMNKKEMEGGARQ